MFVKFLPIALLSFPLLFISLGWNCSGDEGWGVRVGIRESGIQGA